MCRKTLILDLVLCIKKETAVKRKNKGKKRRILQIYERMSTNYILHDHITFSTFFILNSIKTNTIIIRIHKYPGIATYHIIIYIISDYQCFSTYMGLN
jgi:hypothetical protein